MTFAAIACGWLGSKIEAKRNEWATVSLIKKIGGAAYYDSQRVGALHSWQVRAENSGPAWLRGILGENFFSDIEFVAWHPAQEQTTLL